MPYQTTDGNTLPLDRSFTLGGTDYPATWLRTASEEEKQSLGVEWVDPPQFKDERFYSNEVHPDGTVTSHPKDPVALRAQIIQRAKANARAHLEGSDWQIISQVERGRPVPEDWAAYRAAVIAECDRIEAEATAANFDALQLIQENWPENPDEKEQRLAREAEPNT